MVIFREQAGHRRRGKDGMALGDPGRRGDVCLAWGAMLASYRQLNGAKFAVLAEIEKDLPVQPFTRNVSSTRPPSAGPCRRSNDGSQAASFCSTP